MPAEWIGVGILFWHIPWWKISGLYEGDTVNQVNNDGLSRHGNDTKQKQRTADAAAASSWSRLMTHDCSAQSSATRFSSVMIMLSKSMSSDTDHSSKPKALLRTVYTPHSHLKWIAATATTTASLSQTRHFLDSHSYKISSSTDACQLHSTTNSSYLCLQLPCLITSHTKKIQIFQ